MKEENKGLSYSSATLLLGCEERYYHYKVLGTAPDDDIGEDTEAFVFGKAFHEVLENTKHTGKNIRSVFDSVVKLREFGQEKTDLLEACVISYLNKHENNRYKVLACELEIKTDTFIGYVDAVAVDDDGHWVIVDLKTASRIFGALDQKLPEDFQLNIYAYHRQHLADLLGLDINKFSGCSYRVTIKGKKRARKPTEDRNEYLNSLVDMSPSYEYFIPTEVLNPDYFGELHGRLFKKAEQLKKKKAKPIRNYSNCESFFRPCPYWSNCHAKRFTDEGSFQV
jgi:hypothetical protein